jgi:hypothetical protein
MRKASTRLPEQGTQTPSPAPDLIPAEPKNQPRTHIAIGTANGGTSKVSPPIWHNCRGPGVYACTMIFPSKIDMHKRFVVVVGVGLLAACAGIVGSVLQTRHQARVLLESLSHLDTNANPTSSFSAFKEKYHSRLAQEECRRGRTLLALGRPPGCQLQSSLMHWTGARKDGGLFIWLPRLRTFVPQKNTTLVRAGTS